MDQPPEPFPGQASPSFNACLLRPVSQNRPKSIPRNPQNHAYGSGGVRLRKSPSAALFHEPTPAQRRNLPHHSVLRRLAVREWCKPAGREGSPCWIELRPSPCTIHASWCSLAAAPFPSPPLEERGRERRSSFPASTPEIWVRQAAEISPRTAASSGGNGPPLPGPLLQRRRGRAAPPLFASARCV